MQYTKQNNLQIQSASNSQFVQGEKKDLIIRFGLENETN